MAVSCWYGQPANLSIPLLTHSGLQAGKGSEEAGAGSGEGSGGAPTGPTSFANLRQMAGMPPAGQQLQQRKRAGATLVSRLAPPAHRKGKEPQQGDGASAAAAAAAVAVMASSGRMKKT